MYQVIESKYHTLHTLTIHCHNGKVWWLHTPTGGRPHAPPTPPTGLTSKVTLLTHFPSTGATTGSVAGGHPRMPAPATATIHLPYIGQRTWTDARGHAHTRTSMHEAAAATRQRHGRLVRCMGGALAAGGGRRGRHGRWVAVAQQRVDEVVWRPQAGNRTSPTRRRRKAPCSPAAPQPLGDAAVSISVIRTNLPACSELVDVEI